MRGSTGLETIVTLRSARPDDAGLLRRLFDEDRRSGLARCGLEGPAFEAVLDLQYDAHRALCAQWYPGAVDQVIEADGVGAGRILVHETSEEIHVADLAVAETFRGRGLATAALEHWIARADRTGLPVTLKAAWDNPAVRLFKRLGFDHVSTDGAGQLLRRPPGPTTT